MSHPPEPPLFIVAILTIVPGAAALFRDYESIAVRIMARCGGRLEHAIAVDPSEDGAHREVHFLRFPSRQAFHRYRADPELAAMAELRASCIARTEILTGSEVTSGLG